MLPPMLRRGRGLKPNNQGSGERDRKDSLPVRIMPIAKKMPPVDELERDIACDFEAGKLFWKERHDRPGFSPEWHDWWNANCAGREIATIGTSYGAKRIRVNGDTYYAHRIIYKMATGREPEQIDHIDGDRANNAITNLRPADYAANTKNKATYKNNRLGHHNITQSRGRFRVTFKVDGKRVNIGTFSTLEAAISARDTAKSQLGFHANHGRSGSVMPCAA